LKIAREELDKELVKEATEEQRQEVGFFPLKPSNIANVSSRRKIANVRRSVKLRKSASQS
jgi:hypothetical protein